jgi:hypothetical protein
MKLQSGMIPGKWVRPAGGEERGIPSSPSVAQAGDRFQKFLDTGDMLNNNQKGDIIIRFF